MSLDVYLEADAPVKRKINSGIFIRWNGENREVSRAVWDELNPGVEPVTFARGDDETTTLYSRNITHNLGKMADAAGIYHHLWRPDEIGVTKAHELVEPLTNGLSLLINDPDKFEAFNPENGWGCYDGLVAFVKDYLNACEEFPTANVRACR